MNTRNAAGRFTINDIWLAVLAATAIMLCVMQASAADGDLDTSFDGDGRVVTQGFLQNGGRDVVVQPDGKIITVGGKKTPTFTLSNMVAVRYNTDGSLDTSFGVNGEAVVTFLGNAVSNSAFAVAVALQPDGKILLGGTAALQGVSNPNFALVRLNANGTLDTTFGNGGRVLTDVTADQNDQVTSMVFDETRNKIYLAGISRTVPDANFQQKDLYAVVRYDGANGSLDATFNGTGKRLFEVGSSVASNTLLNDIALQADGKIVVTGQASVQVIAGEFFGTARINLDGSLDSTFGTGGIVLTNFPRPDGGFYFGVYAQTISILPNGKIFVAGDSGVGGYAATQYENDGSLSSSFGTSGRIVASGLIIRDSALQTNGKFAVVGLNSNGRFVVGRLNATGLLDTTFGINGVAVTSFDFNGTNLTGNAYAVTLQTDGKIVVSGGAVSNGNPGTDYFLIGRYSGTGVPVNNPALRFADFDGDGKADTSLFRSGTWFINPSGNPNLAPAASYQVQFGSAGDVPTPVDFDGDGKSDIAVWRNATGIFYILNSATGTVRTEQFGLSGDNPTISGDWDGDGKADVATYRGGNQSYFYYRGTLNNPNGNTTYIPWGTSGDTPIFGDFDGDRKLDATIYRPSESRFYVRNSSNGTVKLQQWGTAATDAIFAGDFDGDGKSDFAVQRFSGAEAGTWFVQQSGGSSSFKAFKWGLGTDLPVPADYDGDGKMDFAIYRRSNGTWYIYRSETGTAQYSQFGLTNDFPVPLTYVR